MDTGGGHGPKEIKRAYSIFAPVQCASHFDNPGPNVQYPIRLQAEYTDKAEDLAKLKKEIEGMLHDRLLSRFEVELVPDGTLPRYEMKAKLVRKMWEEN